MECHSIKEKLSAYIENQLSSEEKKQMDEHLKTCPKCRHALEELKKTIAYAQGLEELEPPLWLTQKVMARVKEEVGQKKGILQKLFYPLHIKVPIEVIATIAIAVTTIYVFKTLEPEMRVAKAPSEQVIVSEQQEEKKRASIKDESLAYKETLSEIPKPVEKQRLEKEVDILAARTETVEEPAALAGKKVVPQETDKALDMKVKREAKRLAPQAEFLFKRDIKEDRVLTLYVKDVEKGAKDIEEIVKGLGGEVVKIESFGNKDVLTTELDSKKMKELNEKLRLIGEVKEKDALYALKGNVVIKIEIVDYNRQ